MSAEEKTVELKEKLMMRDKWIRALYMVLFLIIFELIKFTSWAVTLLQFVLVLLLGKANQHLLQFSKSLGRYAEQIIHFNAYNTEEKPFPFSDWPNNVQ